MQAARKPGKHHHNLSRLIESGKFDEAQELATRLSRKHPTDPDIWYALAGLHARRGLIENVIDCCKQVIRLSPNHAGAHYNLGTALRQTGQPHKAKLCFHKCLDIDPENQSALVSLGQLLNSEGLYAEALPYLRKATTAKPLNDDAFYYLGVTELSLGNLDAAMKAYKQAIHIRPDHFKAINNLGHILNEQGKLDESLEIFKRLVQYKPDAPEPYNNLGVVYESMGKIKEAESAYRKAISLAPTLIETKSHLGFLLAGEGRTQEALDCFKDVLDSTPDHEPAIAGKAVALEKLGKVDDACDTLEPAISARSRNPDVILAYCTMMLRKGTPETGIAIAEQLLSTENIPPKGIADLHFALGDLHDKKGDYSRAFSHYACANKASPCTYNHRGHTRYIDNIIKSNSRETLKSLPKTRNISDKIIFIVGMPRSGTSLVEQILASHPDVFGAGELRYINDLCTSFYPSGSTGNKYPAAFDKLKQDDVDTMAQYYLDSINCISGSARLVTDKMPHNFLYLGLISLIFPNAKIIHVSRSPLDNCLSLFFHGFNPMHSYTTDLTMLGRYYREYQRLMSHWRNIPGIRLLEIHYEEVVNDLGKSTRELLEFCALDWSDTCVNFHNSGRFVKTPSYDQVRQPIYTSSVGRWKHYQQFIAPLQSALEMENAKLSDSQATP